MTTRYYMDLEQKSPEWYEARRGIVTASVVGQLVTPSTIKAASNDKSRAVVWELIAERITGYVYPTFTNDDMARGNLAEIVARDWYSREHAEVVECGFVRMDEDWGSLGFSPDGLVGTDGFIEIKSPRHKSHLQTVLADEMPNTYMAQVQAGFLVTGRKWADFISWPGGMAPYVKRIFPDPEWHQAIKDVVMSFEARAGADIATYNERTAGMTVPELIEPYADIEVS
ncbi:lambda exonuclease family protein [Demequina sp. SO4-18]|uniref:lambda exonuclease family protein n=1 Tax=Demequina sp. SO4-18 TaxID=3401026 RepID=UPI003B5C8846